MSGIGRIFLLAFIIGCACLAVAAEPTWPRKDDQPEKFFVTIPGPPFVAFEVRATGRLDAMTKIGATVWTQEEWKQCGEVCSKVKVVKR